LQALFDKAARKDTRLHAEVAGIARRRIEEGVKQMVTQRAFLSRLTLTASLAHIWRKEVKMPWQKKPTALPKFAVA